MTILSKDTANKGLADCSWHVESLVETETLLVFESISVTYHCVSN
jgi:hypothetical protein